MSKSVVYSEERKQFALEESSGGGSVLEVYSGTDDLQVKEDTDILLLEKRQTDPITISLPVGLSLEGKKLTIINLNDETGVFYFETGSVFAILGDGVVYVPPQKKSEFIFFKRFLGFSMMERFKEIYKHTLKWIF